MEYVTDSGLSEDRLVLLGIEFRTQPEESRLFQRILGIERDKDTIDTFVPSFFIEGDLKSLLPRYVRTRAVDVLRVR